METEPTAALDMDLIFKALATSHRREILAMLSEAEQTDEKTCCARDEVCACKISERLGISPSTTSHHMSVLREAGLVSARKDGLWMYYALNRTALEQAARLLSEL